MSSLIDGKVNIGMTNVQRASDGILREITPIMMYKDKYYPYLSFKAGADYIEQKNAKDFGIDANSNLKVFDTKILRSTPYSNGSSIC